MRLLSNCCILSFSNGVVLACLVAVLPYLSRSSPIITCGLAEPDETENLPWTVVLQDTWL